jgi:two-component system, cell cycle response regulator DivK
LDLLRMAGANHCYSRKSVAAALTFAEKLPQVDLVLADINMPGQSGYDLLAAIREHVRLEHVKVVAVTAGTLEEDVQRARDLGFDGFISKPLKATEFASQVQRVLNGESVWDWR